MKTSKTLRDEEMLEKYRKAYPQFSEEQLLEARRNMIKYIQILRRIAIRERMEKEALTKSSKTDKDADRRENIPRIDCPRSEMAVDSIS